MKMKKKMLFKEISLGIVGVILGTISGYLVGLNTKPSIKNNIIYPSSILLKNNDEIGKINIENLEGNINETVSFDINILDNKYTLLYIDINNEKFIPNIDNYFSFNLIEGINVITTYYIESSNFNMDSNILVSIDKNIKNGDIKIHNNNKEVESLKTSFGRTIDLVIEPEDNYYLDKVYINDEYILSPTIDNEYKFRSFIDQEFIDENGNYLNKITSNFIANGEINDDTYNEFLEYTKNYDSLSEIDFTSQELKDLFSIIDLARIALFRVNELDFYTVQNYNEAISNAYFIKNKQGTASSYIKYNDSLMKEVISYSSNCNYAQRIENSSDNFLNLKVYNSYGKDKVSSYNKANFYEPSETLTLTTNEYKEKYFIEPFSLLNYELYDVFMLNEETKICDETFNSSIVKDGDGYLLSLNLSPNSVINYAKYMQTTTSYPGASSIIKQEEPPVFTKVGLKMSLTSDFYLSSIITREEYSVKSIVGDVSTLGYGKSIFNLSQTEYNEIPPLNENVDTSKIYGVIK